MATGLERRHGGHEIQDLSWRMRKEAEEHFGQAGLHVGQSGVIRIAYFVGAGSIAGELINY